MKPVRDISKPVETIHKKRGGPDGTSLEENLTELSSFLFIWGVINKKTKDKTNIPYRVISNKNEKGGYIAHIQQGADLIKVVKAKTKTELLKSLSKIMIKLGWNL